MQTHNQMKPRSCQSRWWWRRCLSWSWSFLLHLCSTEGYVLGKLLEMKANFVSFFIIHQYHHHILGPSASNATESNLEVGSVKKEVSVTLADRFSLTLKLSSYHYHRISFWKVNCGHWNCGLLREEKQILSSTNAVLESTYRSLWWLSAHNGRLHEGCIHKIMNKVMMAVMMIVTIYQLGGDAIAQRMPRWWFSIAVLSMKTWY